MRCYSPPGPALNDADNDGIPDEWETSHGLNPTDAADGRATAADGYTNLELYLNDLVPAPGIDLSADTFAPVTSAALSLKTTGYAPGTYRLYFKVGTDPHVYITQFKVR